MRGKKKVLVGLLATLMLSSVAVTATSCKPKNNGDSSSDSTTTEVQGLTGSYYCSAEDGEYTLSLDGANFELKLGEVTLKGSYTYEGETLVLLADGSSTTAIQATVTGNIITLEYNNATYTFYANVNYTVTFDVDGGSAVEAATVMNGKTLSKPDDPEKAGYRFVGWYLDKEFKTAFAFDSDLVTSDLTLYARYVEYVEGSEDFTVTFVVDGVETETKTTINGKLYDLPVAKSGDKVFAGWWVSDSQDAEKLTYKYTDQVLTQSVKLFAVWADGSVQASVNEDGVTWEALAAGVEYTVKIVDFEGNTLEDRKTTSLSLEYDFSAEPAGEYTITVTANGKTTTLYYQNKALARVSNFEVVDGTMLNFNAVANAEKYLISIECGNASHKHTELDNGDSTNYNFANCEMVEGGIKFTVKAIADGYTTSVSEVFVYNRQLSVVENVAFNASTGALTWDAVENATSYKVEVTANGATKTYTVNTNSMSMKEFTGAITVKVTAAAKGYNANTATEYSYTNEKLEAPVVNLSGDTITWNAVANATGYTVTINGTAYTTTGTSYELPANCKVVDTALAITVQATGANGSSSYVSDILNATYGIVQNLRYENGALAWNPVGGAYSYAVSVNDGMKKEVAAGATSTNVQFKTAGNNIVTLFAYGQDGTYLSKEDVVVEAYMVMFNTNGGSAVDTRYLATGDAMELPTPTKTGYEFAGWYTSNADNAAKYEDTVFTGTDNTIFYAYWESNQYEVKLMLVENVYNSASGQYEMVISEYGKVYVPYGKNYTLPTVASSELTDKSKAFYGWYEDASIDSRKFVDKNGNSVDAWSRLGGHTLYAGLVDVFNYSVAEDADGKYYEVTATDIAKEMTEITVPSTYMDPVTGEVLPVMGIATGAFAGFSNLQVLNIPDTVKSIFLGIGGPSATGSALDKCYALREINVYCVDGEHGEYANHETFYSSEDGMLLRHASPNTPTLDYGKELVFVPYAKRGIVEIPYGVEHITTRSLSYMYNITKIVVPSTVKYLGESVFRGSSYVKSIEFLEAAEGVDEVPLTIGYNCFLNMSSLEELILPTRVGAINFNMQGGAENSPIIDEYTKLTGITMRGKPTAEDAATGNYYKDIDGVLVTSDETTLVYMLASVTGEYTIPNQIEVIGERAFWNSKLSKIIIKDNVTEIGKEAFLNAKAEVIEFIYTKGDLEIADRAFYGCAKLQEIVLPAQLNKIGANAFGDTEEMQDVTLNSKDTATFAAKAFTNDNGEGYVTTLNIGNTVPSFDINSVFAGSTLFTFNINGNTNFELDSYGVLYNAGKTEILYCPYVLDANYTIPSTVEVIGTGVFADRASITKMNIPATVKTIKSGAFKNCGIQTLTFSARDDALTIEANAFEGCVALEEVALPENMTTLANNAFKGCINLAKVTIPSTLTSMTFSNVFADCGSLANIVVAAGNDAFTSKDGILYKNTSGAPTELLFVPSGYTGAVVVPSTVTTIAANTFKGHRGVTSFSFENNTAPETLSLGASLFENAKGLTEVRLPNGLQQISSKMFMGSSVVSIYVPNSVKTVANQAFANCAKLTTLTFEEATDECNVSLTFTAASSAANSAFSGTKKLTYVKLPARTASITNYMFAGSYLEDVYIPSTITSLGTYVFYESKGLKSFTMPDSITTIGTYAFAACENLETLVLSKNLTAIPNYAFGGRPKSQSMLGTTAALPGTKIKSIVIPASVKTIGTYAFFGCKDLTSVTFEDGSQLTSIGNYSFSNTGLTSFTMPNSVTTGGTYMFAGCTNLKSVQLSTKLTAIPNYMFGMQAESSGLSSYTAPYEAAGIESIHIPASVKTIGQNAFKGCTALKTITFDEACQLTKIDNYAFEGSGITSITIPKNNTANTTFGTTIFKNCVSLKSAYLPSSLAGLNNCFLGCSLEVLEVESTGDASSDAFLVDTELGFVMNGDRNNIQLYFGTAEVVEIPAGVTDIAANAFAGNTSLKKIILPASLNNIGAEAFMGCTNLATVEAPANIALKSIGARAFKQSGLTSITVPGSVSSMGESAFEGCESLTTVNLYNMMMAKYLFKNCTALSEVNFMASTVAFYGYTFQGCTSLKSFTWPENVAALGVYEFTESGIENIVLPAYLNNYLSNPSNGAASSGGAAMFEKCANLTSVTIEEGITKIPNSMFVETGLTSVTFPKSLVALGNGAFRDCWSLAEVNFHPETTSMTWYGSTFAECPLVEVDLSHMTGLNLVHDTTYGYFFAGDSVKNPNTTLKTVILPASVTTMPIYMFRYCTALETVIAPGVTAVNNNAFEGCSSLSTLEIDYDNLTAIGNYAFSKCAALTSFKIADTVTTISQYAFQQTGLTSLDLGAGVTSIGNYAFYGSALTSMTIPVQLETVGEKAFGNCANLASFYVEEGGNFKVGDYGELYNSYKQLVVFPMAATPEDGKVTLMAGTTLSPKYAFEGCQNITEVTLSAATTEIPASTFASSSIAVINIPAGVKTISDSAFSGCVNMVSVVLPNSVTSVGASVFSGCTGLTNVTLPKYLATVGKAMFQNCTALTSITLPANVTTIEESAFSGSGLTSIEFPAKLATIKAYAFKNTKLTSVVIPTTVTALGGTTSSSSSGGLSGGLGGGLSIGGLKPGIGGGTTTTTGPVAGGVFEGCTELTTVVIEGLLDTFGKDMFKGCTALTSVTLPAGWDKIEEGMFNGCTSLDFEIPATVESVEKDAFAGWTAEQTITISMSVADANKLWGEGWNGGATVVEK